MGFDHVAIAAGAGKPTIIDVKNNLIRGVRKASDFLMALQLTGAAKRDSLASLQVRLPAIVIGGGLTGIDTTTEAAAYYPVQVSKFLERWETLAAEQGEEALFASLRRRGGGDRARVPRARARGAGGAGARGEGRRSARLQQAGGGVGRRLARLPQGDGRQPRVPAEPRGDQRVLRGGRALRREDVAARVRARRARRAGGRRVRDGDRRQGHAAGALPVRRGGDIAQRDLRARAAGLVRDRSEDEGLPGVQGRRTTTASCASSRRRARRSASSPATSATAARSRSTATTTRATRVRSCARWRRRRTARRTSRRCSRATSRARVPTGRPRATPPGARSPASWTTSGARPSRGSNG